MTEQGPRPVGLTQGAGWQIGARRVFPVDLEQAWALLISPAGQRLWLGGSAGRELARGVSFELDGGVTGKVTTFKPLSHMRLAWGPPGWPRPSILQVRALAGRAGTTVAFHQEHLPGEAEREERRGHFVGALDAIEAQLSPT